jgi:hypothetical protein
MDISPQTGGPAIGPINGVDLADAVRAIRDGLTTAAEAGEGAPLRFELGEIQMEFTVEVRRDARAKGGVRAWVVDAGAEAGAARGSTHRVAFTLKPTRGDGTTGGWRIAADDEGRSWAR